MWANIYSIRLCSDSKYSTVTGSLILLKPGYLNSIKSIFFKPFWLKWALFQVYSGYDMLRALFKPLALLNAIKQEMSFVGLLFAILRQVNIDNTKKSAFNFKNLNITIRQLT